eukprot:gene17753-biopygen11958
MDRHRLGITYIRSLTGSLRSDGTVVSPGELRVRVQVASAGIEAVLVYGEDQGSRILVGVESIRPFRGRRLPAAAMGQIPTRPIAKELTALINDLTSAETAGQLLGPAASAGVAPTLPGPGRRQRITPEFLLSIAEIYAAHATEPSPYVAMSLNKRLVTFQQGRTEPLMATVVDRWAAEPDKRNGKRWDVRWRDEQSRSRRKAFKLRVDAERFKTDIEHALSRGTYRDPRDGERPFG